MNDTIKSDKTFPGLVRANFEYKIASTTGSMDYLGPKIDPNVWHAVVSFFRWTYQTTHSESQCRLYVNPVTREWRAWAFPQEARTGMTAKELEVNETPEQAVERFRIWGTAPSSDWIYFMTAHHHCSAGAFQSGTDLSNEKNQDGLHVTVGNIDAAWHSLHARIYISGTEFTTDLSTFWDVGDIVRQMCPEKVWHDCAVYQMTRRVEVPFPDKWKENIVEVKRDFFSHGGASGSSTSNYAASGLGYRQTDWRGSLGDRVADAVEEILDDCIKAGHSVHDAKNVMILLGTHEIVEIIVRNTKWKGIDFDDITRWMDIKKIPDDWSEKDTILLPRLDPFKKEEDKLPKTQAGKALTEGNGQGGVDPNMYGYGSDFND